MKNVYVCINPNLEGMYLKVYAKSATGSSVWEFSEKHGAWLNEVNLSNSIEYHEENKNMVKIDLDSAPDSAVTMLGVQWSIFVVTQEIELLCSECGYALRVIKKETKQPTNNQGRKSCFRCGRATIQTGFRTVFDVCPICKV